METALLGGGAPEAPLRLPDPPPLCRREELQQPVFLAIDALEFPELHDESIPALAFIKYLGRLMLASGIKDFSQKVRRRARGPAAVPGR